MKFQVFFIFIVITTGYCGPLSVFRHESVKTLVCMSDSPHDAVVWNSNLKWKYQSYRFTDYKNGLKVTLLPATLKINDNITWLMENTRWSATWAFVEPMGPVFDERWESFAEYNTFIHFTKNYRPVPTAGNSNLSFGQQGALVVSIRGEANAQFLVCEGESYRENFCYWLIIGGWDNKKIAMRKCENGIPTGYPGSSSACGKLRELVDLSPLDHHEWRTFVVTWSAATRTIELYDPVTRIFSYTDKTYVPRASSQQSFPVFYGNPEEKFPMLFRFHEYRYFSTKIPGAKMTTSPVKITNSQICLETFVGLCPSCQLIFQAQDHSGNNIDRLNWIISPLNTSTVNQHGLTPWQYVKLNVASVEGSSIQLTISASANSSADSKFWAIAGIQECRQGVVKSISMVRTTDYDRVQLYFWPNVTCQRLSYVDKRNEIVSSIAEVFYPPDDAESCPVFKIGPKCRGECGKYYNNFCRSVVECNKSSCWCMRGYMGSTCSQSCETGQYGLGCSKNCSFCQGFNCNAYTGQCKEGCVDAPRSEAIRMPPFCEIILDPPPLPQLDFITETTVRVFSTLPEIVKNISATVFYEFLIDQRSTKILHAEEVTPNIYYKIFDHLNPGTEYFIRIFISVDYENNYSTKLYSSWKNFTTLCDPVNFSSDVSESTITVDKIIEKEEYPCPDEWYHVMLLEVSKSPESPRKYVHNQKQFPITFSNLSSNTKYKVSITGLSENFHIDTYTVTSEAPPSEVVQLMANIEDMTEASISWNSPLKHNGILQGYQIYIQHYRYEACRTSKEKLPDTLFSSRNDIFDLCTERCVYKIYDLLPYVTYNVSVVAYNSRLGLNNSIKVTTKPRDVPTTSFHDVYWDAEKNQISWRNPKPCWNNTGPIYGAKLFFFGVSQNVANFTDTAEITGSSFILNVTKHQVLHGAEDYIVKIYVLHEKNGKHNVTAGAECYFTTNPYPPPMVRDLEIVEVDPNNRKTLLRWRNPLPPIEGVINEYSISFLQSNGRILKTVIVFPNETCLLWEEYICKSVEQPVIFGKTIKVRAHNRGVPEAGAPSIISDRRTVQAPDAPNIISIVEIEIGIVDLTWEYPFRTGGPLRAFIIHRKKISTDLNDQAGDEKSIQLNVQIHQSLYNIQLTLDPSSLYEISIQGIVYGKNPSDLMYGNASSIKIKTNFSSVKQSESMRTAHETWVVPVVLILLIVAGAIYYRTRARRIKRERNTTAMSIDGSEPMITNPRHQVPSHENLIVEKVEPVKRAESIEYRESILMTLPINGDVSSMEVDENHKFTSLIKLNEFQDYVKNAVAMGLLDKQYSMFPRGQTKAWEYGKLPKNKGKNRYGNLIAYDETRVILEKLPDDPYSDYINANYIKGFKKTKAYIATQGPKPQTLIDFWRMVWQDRVQVICMLANVLEGGKTKCEQYWPEIGQKKIFGNVSVSNISHTVFADYTFRIFHITCDEETRKIDHLHYTAWPDHGIPLYTQSVATYLKKLLATPAGNGPVLVHCSAGVGRTGTIILCEICLRRAAAEGVVDVYRETAELRNQRANMVDNAQQYLFAHLCLVECLLTLPTAIPCNESLPTRILEYKKQLSLHQQRLEGTAWQDNALQPSAPMSLKLAETNLAKIRFPQLATIGPRLFIARYPLTDEESNFIFGVYVDSARRKNNYIASQLPLPNTLGDFWRMVAEFNVELIIVLQPPAPDDPSCCKFLPDLDEEIQPVPFLIVKGKAVTDMDFFYHQKVVLVNSSEKPTREHAMTILTSKEWEAGRNKVPPKPAALVELWQMAERTSRGDEPTVVLCHDGVTSCGLYLALSFLLERMGLERECDVCLAIRAIRRSRPDFCQAPEQFEYLYDSAVAYAECFETYANFL